MNQYTEYNLYVLPIHTHANDTEKYHEDGHSVGKENLCKLTYGIKGQ